MALLEIASTDLPVGTAVEVIVVVEEESNRSEATPDDDKWADFDSVVGAWKDDENIKQVFEGDSERSPSPVQPRNTMDTLIAAIARSNSATLVTHNTRDFENIPGLTLEDWLI